MMRQYELVERVLKYNPKADEDLLNRAYVYAMRAHGSQKRASGDPYFSHPLEVAGILTDLKLDDATIAVALLHDTIEDTSATRKEIDEIFGPEIGKLVDGLTKLKKLDFVTQKAKQGENLRKLFLAIADDVRVLLVKLADRLHNMRTLHYVPPAKRVRISEETMEIYAPLAARMGMQDLKEELEELSFRNLNQDAFQTIRQRLENMSDELAEAKKEIETALTEKLVASHVNAKVMGRTKRPYSIFRKIERTGSSFDQLSDVLGFRLIVDNLEDCYRALGIVHTTWKTVPGRFKDYISTPKENDYRSLHTTIVGPRNRRVELQIRDRNMHEIAEYGIAAHALYKDGSGKGGRKIRDYLNDSRAYSWLRRTVDTLAVADSADEFLENTKLELFSDQVFCFTPKGKIIALPRGATPIDFAYAVHTNIGDTCVGAKINGRIMPLVTNLHNGDEVDIIRSEASVPPSAWESIVVTGKARSAIRRATRVAIRHQYSGLGRQVMERAFEREGKVYSDALLQDALSRLSRQTVDDALASVGRGDLSSDDVLKAIFPDRIHNKNPNTIAPKDEGWFGLKKINSLKFRVPGRRGRQTGGVLPIRGLKSTLPVAFSEKSGAVPGDRIVGILTPGEGITIYPIHSPDLIQFENEPERWLDVRWDVDLDEPDQFPAKISVTSINEPGSLAEIARIVSENEANIDNLIMTRKGFDFHDNIIDVEVWDLKHLNRIITALKASKVVSSVSRVDS
jgi:guanosine-3',5'-bis(diphosphate) 3'-pyrophosphohydrolase